MCQRKAHIALQVVGLPGLDHVTGVRQTGPLVQAGDVVGVVDLDLALLGQFNTQHVHWQVELGLGLVEVLLVEDVTGDLSRVHSQHDQRVVPDTEGSDVVAHLLTVPCLVLVLMDQNMFKLHIEQPSYYVEYNTSVSTIGLDQMHFFYSKFLLQSSNFALNGIYCSSSSASPPQL